MKGEREEADSFIGNYQKSESLQGRRCTESGSLCGMNASTSPVKVNHHANTPKCNRSRATFIMNGNTYTFVRKI